MQYLAACVGDLLYISDVTRVQSLSNAVHPFRRLTNPQVALFFRVEDSRIALPASAMMSCSYGACPKNETCAFSEGLTHHCTGAGGVGYEKFLDWPSWKQPLPTRVLG